MFKICFKLVVYSVLKVEIIITWNEDVFIKIDGSCN